MDDFDIINGVAIIPEGTTKIGWCAFYNCKNLKSITIPNSVKEIGKNAFCECTGLTEISVAEDNPVYDSREGCNAIIETATNKLIAGCKSTIIPNSVKKIGESAFVGCSGLTKITIPNSVTEIERYAFSNCTSLTEISVAEGNQVYDSREGCNAIIETATNKLIAGCKSTIIPNSVKEIGENAFCECTGLTEITIPNSVKEIGWHAFYNCKNLKSITIPNSVKKIGERLFSGWENFNSHNCENLTEIKVAEDNPVYDSREGCNAIIETATNKLIAGCKSTIIPNSVKKIGESAFSGCTGLTTITIPNSVTEIGGWAFSGCENLKSITIPNSVKEIGWCAFSDCKSLTEITIPNSVKEIGESTFWRCSSLNTIYVTKGDSERVKEMLPEELHKLVEEME